MGIDLIFVYFSRNLTPFCKVVCVMCNAATSCPLECIYDISQNMCGRMVSPLLNFQKSVKNIAEFLQNIRFVFNSTLYLRQNYII